MESLENVEDLQLNATCDDWPKPYSSELRIRRLVVQLHLGAPVDLLNVCSRFIRLPLPNHSENNLTEPPTRRDLLKARISQRRASSGCTACFSGIVFPSSVMLKKLRKPFQVFRSLLRE